MQEAYQMINSLKDINKKSQENIYQLQIEKNNLIS